MLRQLRDANEGLEDKVRTRTADLTRANEEIQRFAYIVSHDLRSPLVNVMGFTAELDNATKSIVELIDRVAGAGARAVTPRGRPGGARGFARGDQLHPHLDRQDGPADQRDPEIVARRAPRAEPRADRHDRTGRRHPRQLWRTVTERAGSTIAVEPLPAIVSDRVAVEQIFSNLIENATKYLETGRAGTGRVSRAAARARARSMTVADNGRGIDPKDHARIFDLFRRSGRQDQPGEGIGLAHARALAIRLGGMIEVASTLGEGATFRRRLPLQYDAKEDRNP